MEIFFRTIFAILAKNFLHSYVASSVSYSGSTFLSGTCMRVIRMTHQVKLEACLGRINIASVQESAVSFDNAP